MLAVATSSLDFVTIPWRDEGYFCPEGFAPRQRPRGDGFPDDARLGRIPVAEHRVESCNIAVNTDDVAAPTATYTTTCRTPTLSSAAARLSKGYSLCTMSYNNDATFEFGA